MEYSSLFADVNQVSLRFQSTEFSEVMVVHRMYVRLTELDMTMQPSLNMIAGSERVKRLYVLADVVELPSVAVNMRLPANVSVVILCRVLYIPDINTTDFACGLHFPLMRLRVVEARLGAGEGFPLQSSTSDGSGASASLGLYIHADRFIYRQASTSSSFIQPLQLRALGEGSTFSTQARAGWPEKLDVSTLICWFSRTKGPHLTPSQSDLQRSDEIELLAPPSPDQLDVNFLMLAPGGLLRVALLMDNTAGYSFFPTPVPKVPRDVLADPFIIVGLQMNMLIAELVLAAHNSQHVINVVTRHVEWLNKILLQIDSPSNDLLEILFRVQAYKKMATQPRYVVPRLQYHMYSNLINRMVDVAKFYDQEFRALQRFIAQNEILGSYLLQQNKALAARERDMSGFHSQVVALRRSELISAIERMDTLSAQMKRESQAMEDAKDAMIGAIEEYQRRQLANALFAVLGAIASVALAFVTGGATAPGAVAAAGAAVTAAGQLAAGLKKVVEILEGLQAVMEIVAAIRELVETLQNMGQLIAAPEMPELPSSADWQIFVNEVEAVAAQIPTEVSEVPVWTAKCKNVAVLGQEMCTTAAHIGELTYQVKVEEMLQEIAERQANRLEGITSADLSSYTEMASQIDMRNTRLLLSLIRVLHIQNAALKYEYLYDPSGQLNSWPVSMETVWTILLQQESAALLGLQSLGPSNDFTATYVVKDIPVHLLLEGSDWNFEIPAVGDYAAFPAGWSRVRIRYVELKFVQQGGGNTVIHQPSTRSGLVYLLLQSSRFFHDRRREQMLDYEASMGVAYAYAYNLATGDTTLSNIPSQEYANTFMRMTPFNNWRLRLSASAAENQGLAFPTATARDSTTQIAITFYVTAIRRIDTREQAAEGQNSSLEYNEE